MKECGLHCKVKDEEMEDFCELIWSFFEGILNEESKCKRLWKQERKIRIFICVCLVFTRRNTENQKQMKVVTWGGVG